MFVYFIPFVAFLFLTVGSSLVPRRAMRIMVLMGVIACAVFAGFRFDVDNDFNSYVGIFDGIPPITRGWVVFLKATSDLYLEPPFAFFVALVKSFLSDLWVFPLVAAVSLFLYYRSFCRVTSYPAVAFLIYLGDGYYLREFTQIRFGLAVALGLAGLVALYENKVWRYYRFIAFACMFHFTAVMLPAAQIWIRFATTRSRVLFFATIFFVLALAGVFDGLVERMAGFGIAASRISGYIDSTDSESVSAITISMCYVMLLWMSSVISDKDKDFFWVSIYALSFVILCLFSGFDLMRRVSFYFSVALYMVSAQSVVRRRVDFLFAAIVFSAMLFSARLGILRDYQSWIFT